MRVLVTGAAGFIGSHAVEALLEQGHSVVGLDNLESVRARTNLRVLAAHPCAQRFRFERMDVRDGASVRALCRAGRFDALIHLAAVVGVRASTEQAAHYVEVNVGGSLNVLEAAKDGGVSQVVFASSSSVYGSSDRLPMCETDPSDRPQSPYAASKRAVELLGASYHHLHGLHFTALRFFTVYGTRNRPDMFAHQVLDHIACGRPITLYHGGQLRRDWTYVTDIVKGIVAAAQCPLDYQIINLARGEDHSLNSFVGSIERASGLEAQVHYAPAPSADMKRTLASIDKARELLGYAPQLSLEAGARALWDWYRQSTSDRRCVRTINERIGRTT